MNIKFRKPRKAVVISVSVVVLYWIFLRKRRYTETFTVTLESVEPKVAWEFVADFSNQVKMNPSMDEFEIEYEKGNYALWEYAVTYKEHLVQFPFIHNSNWAKYRVTPETHKGHHQPYRIDSEHICCFLFFCLNTDAELLFSKGKEPQSTEMVEIIHYECPTLFSYFCRREVQGQRKHIHEKLYETDFNAPF